MLDREPARSGADEIPRNGVVGTGTPVTDARMKVTGRLRYVDDMKLPGMLHAKVLFSPVAHARIKRIDTSKARSLPGVRAVVTYEDSPQTLFNANGEDADVLPSQKVLDSRVRYFGDMVAGVAADTVDIAAHAVSLIDVEYEELPCYLDAEAASAPGAVPLHPEVRPDTNVLMEVVKTSGDVLRGFERADLVLDQRFEVPAIHHAAMEPHVCICDYDAMGKLTVWTPTQDVFGQRANLAKAFGLPQSRVRVVDPGMGGGFGGKIDLVCEPVCSLLAMKAGRPVKLCLTRAEDVMCGPTRHAEIIYAKTGFTAAGEMCACDYTVYLSCGAQSGGSMSVAWAAGGKFFKAFKCPDMRYRAVPAYTNRSSAGAMRGFGSPQMFYVFGCQFNEAARRLGLDAADVFSMNLRDPDEVDGIGEPVGNFRAKDCVERGRALFGWDAARAAARKANAAGGRYRVGVAINVAPHGSSLFGIMPDTCGVMIKMNEDGSITLFTGVSDMGNGSNTVQAMIVSEVLGIPIGHIALVHTDTESTLYDVGAFGSRGTYVGGGAALKCARLARRAIVREAVELLGCAASQVRLRDDGCEVAGDPSRRVTMRQVAEHAHACERDVSVSAMHGTEAAPISAGAHFCQVRVDTRTGEVRVERYAAVHDVGRPLNPMGLEGQVHGGVQMGLGYALSEGLQVDERGRMRRRNLRDCHLFRSTDMPRDIRVEFLDSCEHTGPFGAKSVGECGTVPVAGCVAAAVGQALGTSFTKLPIAKEDVLCALMEQGR